MDSPVLNIPSSYPHLPVAIGSPSSLVYARFSFRLPYYTSNFLLTQV